MKDKIIIIGGGGHARVLISVIKKLNKYDIIGYTDIEDKGILLGIKYLGTDIILKDILKENNTCKAAIGVGVILISDLRKKLFEKIKSIGFELPPIVSTSAIISEDVIIGEGTVILEGAIINPGAELGKCVIVNTCAVVEHDCVMGDFVHLTAGSIAGGGVEIMRNSILGIGAKVIQYKKVCENCLIGAGSIVIKDILIPGTYFGIPARRIDII